MNCLIIIPTYNEIENIKNVIDLVFSETSGLSLSILVVDDNSPDGTAQVVNHLIEEKYSDRLFMLQRSGKQGLASAYIAGFKWGIERNFDILIEMDADLSHNPIYLRGMIDATKNYDVIAGSRYVSGGGVRGWGFLRTLISKGGSFYSRFILGIPVRDVTGGFNVWKRKVLDKIGLDNVISKGYSFQIELKYRAYKLGFAVLDFPIIFENRNKGKSKMSKKIFVEALLNVWKLKFLKLTKETNRQ